MNEEEQGKEFARAHNGSVKCLCWSLCCAFPNFSVCFGFLAAEEPHNPLLEGRLLVRLLRVGGGELDGVELPRGHVEEGAEEEGDHRAGQRDDVVRHAKVRGGHRDQQRDRVEVKTIRDAGKANVRIRGRRLCSCGQRRLNGKDRPTGQEKEEKKRKRKKK